MTIQIILPTSLSLQILGREDLPIFYDTLITARSAAPRVTPHPARRLSGFAVLRELNSPRSSSGGWNRSKSSLLGARPQQIPQYTEQHLEVHIRYHVRVVS
jgi:hypothetical protein